MTYQTFNYQYFITNPAAKPDAALVRSIKENGITFAPIIGQELPSGYVRVFDGNRRIASLCKAIDELTAEGALVNHLVNVPVYPVENEQQAVVLSLASHGTRGANPFQEYLMVKSLRAQRMKGDDIFNLTGFSNAQQSNLMLFDRLIPDLLELVKSGKLLASTGQAIAKLPHDKQKRALEIIESEGKISLKQVKNLKRVDRQENVASLAQDLTPATTDNGRAGYSQVIAGIQQVMVWANGNEDLQKALKVALVIAQSGVDQDGDGYDW